MEVEGETRQSSQDDKNTKRKMKTPTQLETLEKVFAEEKYPSEAVRAELSAQLGLSDRQLQMWFCHRRLKDRKVKEEENTATGKKPKKEKNPSTNVYPASVLASEILKSAFIGGGNYDEELRDDSPQEIASRSMKQAGKRASKDFDITTARRKSQHIAFKGIGIGIDPRRAAELRGISAVESQLGEALRQDGPILGVDFDPLPPGAFDTPIASFKPAGVQENRILEKREAKSRKYSVHESRHLHTGSGKHKTLVSNAPSITSQGGTRTLQEYQFIPEQPSSRNEDSQIHEKNKFYMGSDYAFPSFSASPSFLHGTDSLLSAFNLQGRLPNIGGTILPQFDSCRSNVSHRGIDFEGFHQDPFPAVSYNGQLAAHGSSAPLLVSRTSHGNSDKMALLHEQEQLRMEKKRKFEEARIAKEVEAHEKKIKREMERQETARRKKEELIRKELEKQDREKKREEERVLREKQREEERIQREQRREFERRERLLQKETKRMELQRQKEEIRQQREAAKMKAALERATARRLARESIELIDDERLELLEAAAASQNLPSIYLLDGETLQGLDKYRGVLKNFPPPPVKMKKPITCRPWIDTDENIGNLLMVWKFITTFADVLGLWPFTVDEFVQAFHDYDPRLLGEIHISLLKALVKDIEDVSQASASGMVVNQYTVSFTGGGHPQLVEAAFAWGFDIRDWQKHLNALTWPEILRQFALAAGYGPKWKKRKVDNNSHDDNEGHDGEEAVNTLRSGVAVANAVALMRGKGGGPRRSRHRLTPGTVKYAAFHVLSVEGKNGLNILEVADRIQKSGLRDLTTSKTPEASIAAALSRDTRLFERVAPSTYCVRTPYRKDPEDAEAILHAARERICLFQTGGTDQEEAEKENEDVDEAEREEDSEEDAEDVLADDVDAPVNEGKVIFSLREGRVVQAEKEKPEQMQNNASDTQTTYCSNTYKNKTGTLTDLGIMIKSVEVEQEGSIDLEDPLKQTSTSEKVEIDESNVGEPWVQGLMEGEYSDLSVEERLKALVVLVEMVNEGNTIRVALEERLEAANALRRQMWAEAQLDRRRFKEEQLLRFQPLQGEGARAEGSNPGLEEGQESPGTHDISMDVAKPKTEWPMEQAVIPASENALMALEKSPGTQVISNQEAALASQAGFATDKSRAQLKADIGLRAEELYVYRSLPLGSDRRHNRYWQFVTCTAGQDPGCRRIYFESSKHGHWEVIDTEESLNALMTSLDVRGIREAHLHASLQKVESLLKQGMIIVDSKAGDLNLPPMNDFTSGYSSSDGSSGGCTVLPGNDLSGQNGAISVELGYSQIEKQNFVERYTDLERWLWSQCSKGSSYFNASKVAKRRSDLLLICDTCHDFYWLRERHCSCCHATLEPFPKLEAKFAQHQLECEERRWRNDSNWKLQGPSKLVPSRIQLLKAEILAIEAAIPAEALKATWTDNRRKSWASMLKRTSSPADLLQVLTEIECSVERNWLSPSYETTDELLRGAASQSKITLDNSGTCGTAVLPWVPHTTAAVALRLAAFDAAISYSTEQKLRRSTEIVANAPSENVMNGCAAPSLEKFQNLEVQENQSCPEEEEKVDACIDVPQSGRGRGRGGRPRARGRGRNNTANRGAVSTDAPQGLKMKLHFSSDDTPANGKRAEKKGRGRPRSVRGRGRGLRTLTGCGCGPRSGRPRQSDIQKNKVRSLYSNADWQTKESLPEQTSEQEGDQSDGGASQSMDEWDAQEYGEGDNFEQQQNVLDEHEQDNDEDEDLDSPDEDDSEQEEHNLEEDYEVEEEQLEEPYTGRHTTAGTEDDAESGSSSSSSSPSSSSSRSSSSSLSSSSSSEGGTAGAEEDEVPQSLSIEESD